MEDHRGSAQPSLRCAQGKEVARTEGAISDGEPVQTGTQNQPVARAIKCTDNGVLESGREVRPGTKLRERYRVGSRYGIHVYSGDRPVATFFDAREAEAFVAAANADRSGT